MTIRIETGPEQCCRAIVDGSMTIYQAATDKSVLLDALAHAKEAEIDLSAVCEMDTAGLQILILAKRESVRAGKVMRLVGHSPVSLDVIERYGLSGYFGDRVGSAADDPVASAPRGPRKRRAKTGVKAKGRRAP